MRYESATNSKSAIFPQQQNDEEMPAKQGPQEVQANMNVMHNEAVVTEPDVNEFVHDDEPMAVANDNAFVHEETTHMSPVISIPEENIP
jgi:hypothetical protein